MKIVITCLPMVQFFVTYGLQASKSICIYYNPVVDERTRYIRGFYVIVIMLIMVTVGQR